jgi:hypothetical protein
MWGRGGGDNLNLISMPVGEGRLAKACLVATSGYNSRLDNVTLRATGPHARRAREPVGGPVNFESVRYRSKSYVCVG